MHKNKRYALLLTCLMLLAAVFPASAQEPRPLYPAIQGNQWGYIDADNQWVVPPYTSLQPDYAYDNDFFYDHDSDDWRDVPGRRYPMDEILDPARWGLTELNGQEVYWCNGQRLGQRWLVRCHAKGEEIKSMAWVHLDNDLNRLNDLVYFVVILSEDEQTLIALTEKGAVTGSLVDDRGRILREGLPFGELSEDGLVITNHRGRDVLYYNAQTGTPLSELQAAALHAAHCPEGLWPCKMVEQQDSVKTETETTDWSWDYSAGKEEIAYFVYVDADGSIAEHLGRFERADSFRQGLATVKTEDGQQKIIDTMGNTVLANVGAVNNYLYNSPIMQDGWAQVTLFAPKRHVSVGGNYLNTEGQLLFSGKGLYRAKPFFEGRALVHILLQDYTLTCAHIDPAGNIVWAEDGADIAALQALLDQGLCPSPADLSAEEAMNLLLGEWASTGGGEHLTEVQHEDGSWSASLTRDGTWYVRETKHGDPYYRDYRFVFVEVFTDANGYERTSEAGLTIYHRDAFSISWGEGSSGYVRYRSRYDEQ